MANEKRLIDVNELIDWIDIGHLRNPLETCYSERDVVDMLECRTTVDAVEVVHGRWIPIEECLDEDGNGQYQCSECGVGEKHNPTVPVSYCWNCGAKMDLKGE